MVNKHLFELYIRDLLAAITNNSAIQLSLGLPSHHAHPTYPSGFCFINKLAVLAIFNEKLHEAPIRHLSIGIDVNHDDGLKAVLEKTEIKYHLIDALDEEVFPKTSLKALTDEEKYHAYTVGGKRPRPKVPPLYQQELGQIVGYQLTPAKAHNSFSTLLGFNMNYPHEPQVCSAFALNLYHRKDIRSPHPILNHIFTLLEREIKAHKHLVFYIPLGFDSSINDCTFDHDITVAKGQTLDEVKRNRRFTTQDYIFFYKKLLDLYKANPEKIKAIYISLEGGYDANVLPHELRILIEELDVLNQSYYQNLNMQITIHEEEKLWALVVPKLQRALENNKLSFAERYSLLSKLCYAHVECQQTPEAQRIYQQLKTMEETASEDFITQGNSKTKKRKRNPLHHSPLFAKKDSSQSTEAEKVDYLSKLENITKVLLDSHLYNTTNLQRLIDTELSAQNSSLLIQMANFEILNQHTFNQVITSEKDFLDSIKPLFNDYADYLSALEKGMDYIKDNPSNRFKLLTNTRRPTLNICLIFILHFLTSNGDTYNFKYFSRLITGLNKPQSTLVEAFKYLRLNNIKLDQLAFADINALLNNPVNAYQTAVQFFSAISKIPHRSTIHTSESTRPLPKESDQGVEEILHAAPRSQPQDTSLILISKSRRKYFSYMLPGQCIINLSLQREKPVFIPPALSLVEQPRTQSFHRTLRVASEPERSLPLAQSRDTMFSRAYKRKLNDSEVSPALIESFFNSYTSVNDKQVLVQTISSLIKQLPETCCSEEEQNHLLQSFIYMSFAQIKQPIFRAFQPRWRSLALPKALPQVELNEPETYFRSAASRQRFAEAHYNSISLNTIYKAHYQSTTPYREAYFLFIIGLMHDKKNNYSSAAQNLINAYRLGLHESDREEIIKTIIKILIKYFHQNIKLVMPGVQPHH